MITNSTFEAFLAILSGLAISGRLTNKKAGCVLETLNGATDFLEFDKILSIRLVFSYDFFTKMPVSKMTLSAKIALDGNKVLIGAGKQSDLACIVRKLSQSYLEIRGSNVQLNSE